MAFRLTKAESKRKRELTDKLREAALAVQARESELQDVLRTVADPVNVAVSGYNNVADEVRTFAEEVATRLRDEYDEKSEKWQASDAGQAALSMAEEWEGVDLPELEHVELVEPDTLEAEAADSLDVLPEEPS